MFSFHLIDEESESESEPESESESEDEQDVEAHTNDDEHDAESSTHDEEQHADHGQDTDDELHTPLKEEKDKEPEILQLKEDEELAKAIQESLNVEPAPRYDQGSTYQPFPFFYPSVNRYSWCRIKQYLSFFLSE